MTCAVHVRPPFSAAVQSVEFAARSNACGGSALPLASLATTTI